MVVAGLFALMAGVVPVLSDAGCRTVSRPVRVGQVIVASDLGAPISCSSQRRERALRYDPNVVAARALRDLAAGDIILRVENFALPEVRQGEELQLRTQVGPVLIERRVTALQPGRHGGKIFVKTEDGDIFATSLEGVAR